MEAKITKEMSIAEVLRINRMTAPIFMQYGMHCLSCPHATAESASAMSPSLRSTVAMRDSSATAPFTASTLTNSLQISTSLLLKTLNGVRVLSFQEKRKNQRKADWVFLPHGYLDSYAF